MSLFWKYFDRIKKYQSKVWLSLLCHLLTAIFTVFSIPMIIPFFELLFDISPENRNREELASGMLGDYNPQVIYFDLLQDSDKMTALIYVCVALVIVFFFKNIFQYLSRFFMIPVRNGIIRDLRNDLYRKVLDLPLSFFKEHPKGDLITRFSADTLDVEMSILRVVQVMIKSPIIIIGSLIFMLYFSPQMTGFVFVLLLFTVVIIGGVTRSLKRDSRLAQSSLGRLISTVEEGISGIKVIKSFSGNTYQLEKFEEENNNYKSLIDKVLWRNDLSSPLSEFLGVTVVTVLLWYGSSLVFSSALEPATFFAFILAFYHIIEPAKSFSTAYYSMIKGTAAMERIDFILSIKNPIENIKDALVIDQFNESIRFEDVYFSYDDEDQYVLKNVSFLINKGDKIALVGASGEGKTTILDLLVRFYDVNKGQIAIDGKNIKSIDLKSLNGLFSIVDQNAALFHDTVAHNIAMTRDNIDMSKVVECARVANASLFIEDMPNKYNSLIGEQGTKLSGGQRQRIILARALYKDASIILLDEATSALDSESEKLIQQSLTKILTNKTAIIVAHRLNTIKEADRILVLKDGNIAEMGNHETLLNLRGIYYEMVTNQQL